MDGDLFMINDLLVIFCIDGGVFFLKYLFFEKCDIVFIFYFVDLLDIDDDEKDDIKEENK